MSVPFRQRIFFVCFCLCLLLPFAAIAQSAQDGPPVADFSLKLKAYTFDPLTALPQLPPALTLKQPAKAAVYRIIQFDRPLTRKQRETLQTQYGLKLDKYLPNQAYLEKLSAADAEKLKGLFYFRWSGPYQPAYKLDPAIGQRTFVSKARKEATGFTLIVLLFPAADLNAVAEKIAALGVEVLNRYDHRELGTQSRLRVQAATREQIEAISQIDAVEWIEEQGDITEDNAATSRVIQSDNAAGAPTPIYAQGIRGEGQIIGIIDRALDVNHCLFSDAANPIGPAHRKVVGYRQDTAFAFAAAACCGDRYNAAGVLICNSGHGTHTAGTAAGQTAGGANNGIAFNARLTYGDSTDLSWRGGTRSFIEYLNAAHADGAHIHSNSWSDKSTTSYTVESQDLDTFTWNNEDDLVVVSSSNNIDTNGDNVQDAPSPPRPPWTSKNGLSVAATLVSPNQASVSTGGQGPTFDNRRKPDIYAPGDNTTSSQAGTNCGTMNCGGSSMSTPAVAGAAALTRQYYTEGWYPSGTQQPHHALVPSGALLKATLLNATRDMNGNDAFGNAAPLTGYPSNLEGWGRLVLDDALFFNGDARNLWVWDVRHANGLATGESHNYRVNVVNNAQPLKVTLVWTDAPPEAASFGAPVVNNLDLTVIDPNGTTFLGNVFAAGQSTAGGAADAVNNVEQVLINAPLLGEYQIQVAATAVNEGKPGQGYALVATADTEDPPVPTGDQNTLVVRVGLTDLSGGTPPSLASVQNIMTTVSNYFDEVSYAGVSIDPVYPNPVTLPHASTYYNHPSRNLLIEMSQDVIDALIAADANVFDRGTAATADDIDRMLIVINDPMFVGDWATTGPWPYDLPTGLTRRISVSVHSLFNDPEERFAHGLGHQFGLVDLYAHPNVTFAQPHVDEWDNMATPFTNSDFMAWSKERAAWITNQGSTIDYIPRPAAGASVDQIIGLNFLSSTNTDRKAIAVGLTEGAATLADEDVFYMVELRSNAAGTVDAVLPETGALLYFVHEGIPQGEGPVRIIDRELATLSLADAAFDTTDAPPSNSATSAGLTAEVQAGTGTADRNIRIQYDPPDTDNDVNIVVGSPHWTSPDIWVDSQKDGFDADNGRVPRDRGDQPVTGETNRIYVRLHNPGPDDAYDFNIVVRVSEPYHTVGGSADFNRYVDQIYVPKLDAGATFVDYVEWTPDEDNDPHSCIEVRIPHVFNDINLNNNRAQQNVEEVESTTASPYAAVTYKFGFTNPEATRELFYFRPEGVPAGWSATLNPRKALLNAGQRIEATFTVQPPDDAPVCTEQAMTISSWMPRGDTLIPVGGGTFQVDLRNQTDITITTGLAACDNQDPRFMTHALLMTRAMTQIPLRCARITAQGCTNPPRSFEEIIVRYEDPAGNPVYRTVTTDAAGCYSDFYTTGEGGTWEVTAEYPGNDCSGSSMTPEQEVGVPLPETGDQDGDGVPDADEPQGDYDRDGLPCVLDSDCDGDGIPDGSEPAGDVDRDGHDNIADADSDGDGITDGDDWFPYGPTAAGKHFSYSFHVGATHPISDLNADADANVHVRFDLDYALSDVFDAVLFAGLNQFTTESAAGIDHQRWTNLSVNLKRLFPTTSGLDLYLQGGGGAYWPKSGSADFGFNFGAGAQIPISGPFKLDFGMDYHQVQDGVPDRFFTFQLGVIFR